MLGQGPTYNFLKSMAVKLIRYGKVYGNADPEMVEGDVFRMLLKVPEYSAANAVVGEEGSKSLSLY